MRFCGFADATPGEFLQIVLYSIFTRNHRHTYIIYVWVKIYNYRYSINFTGCSIEQNMFWHSDLLLLIWWLYFRSFFSSRWEWKLHSSWWPFLFCKLLLLKQIKPATWAHRNNEDEPTRCTLTIIVHASQCTPVCTTSSSNHAW